MMPAVDFPEANFTFSKPSDMTDEQCHALQVWKGKDESGFPLIWLVYGNIPNNSLYWIAFVTTVAITYESIIKKRK